MFDTVLAVLLALIFGIIPAACGVILKLFGLQDIFYYFFLKKTLPLSWNWLTFTPLGLLKKTLTRNEVLIQAFAGIVISAAAFYFLL